MALPLAALAIPGAIQAGFGIVEAIRQNKQRKQRERELESAVRGMPEYTESPIVKGMYAQAQAQQNAINPAVQAMYRQSLMNAANVSAAGQRNAASGAEAINAAIGGQSMVQQQAPQIAEMQTNFNLQNLANAQNMGKLLNRERQNVFTSQVAKNDALQNLKTMQFANAQKQWQDAWGNVVGGANSVLSNLNGELGKKP